jgi:hypothetical protein
MKKKKYILYILTGSIGNALINQFSDQYIEALQLTFYFLHVILIFIMLIMLNSILL